MPFPKNPKPKITLEELMALNDEIIALVKAGVPLELGLAEMGEEREGVLGRLSTQLAARMNQGESLPKALEQVDVSLPRSYRAIVEAGLKAGRLTSALEGISKLAFKMSELRRRIGLAMIYPLIVLMLAYGLFLVTCSQVAPRMELIFKDLGVSVRVYELLSEIGRTAVYWGWLPPLVVIGLIIWWRRNGQRFLTGSDGLGSWCPGLRRITAYYRSAQFADLLALLVEQNVPMPEAIVLAAGTTNDARMQNTARSIADAATRGEIALGGPRTRSGFPPFLHWLITRRDQQQGLVSALKAAGDMYRRRAILITDWIQFAFPMIAAVVIGGGATFLYVLTVFYPFTEFLKALSKPFV